jgi:uncharacterized spore protein YtfJ
LENLVKNKIHVKKNQIKIICVYSVASRISKLWGIVPHSIEKCGGFEKNVGDIHLPYNMTYRKEFICFTFSHF